MGVTYDAMPPAAALLRRPATMLRHELMTALHEAGFEDVLPAHLGVFQHPGPDGMRPGLLAQRNASSKQAMNHLLHQLEQAGYLLREQQVEDRRLRVVRLTDRGWAAYDVIVTTVEEVDKRWAELIGDDYPAFRRGLARIEEALEPQLESW